MLDTIARLLNLYEGFPRAMFYWHRVNDSPFFQDWLDAGYYYRCQDADSIRCPECDEGFVMVDWVENENGVVHGYRCCPQCGYEEISPDEVKRFRVDFSHLFADIIRAMEFDIPTEEIPDTVWTLGRRRRKNFVYIRPTDDSKIRNVRRMFANSPETVFIVSTISKIQEVEAFSDNCVVAFEQFIDWEDRRIVFHRDCFDAFFGGDELTNGANKDKKRRAVRLAKIEELKKLLLADASSRIGNMDAQAELGCEYEIPKRPKKKELAAILKMAPVDVTNCFKDEEGKTLVLLYENLDSLDGLGRLRMYLDSVRYAYH